MELITQHIVMAKDLNAHGNLFGGIMLAWLDEASAIYAMRRLMYTNIVTVSMDDVSFKTPGRLGDIIQIFSEIEKVGRSSIHIKTSAFSIGNKQSEKKEIIQCKIIFVCLDGSGKPFPYPEINRVSLGL